MNRHLPQELAQDLLRRGYNRRSFGRLAALLAGGAGLSFYNEPALAQFSNIGALPDGAVKINANENPAGPCPEARAAIARVAGMGGRYQYEEASIFARALAEAEGLKPDYVMPFPGSSDALHRMILAFTSPGRSLVLGDPGYEAGERAARYIGAAVHKVPLTPSYAHDVEAMVKADPNAGVFYLCNPNNPSGTVTPRAAIEWLLANKPAGSILLLDEAYVHFTEEPYGTSLVAKDRDIVALRTFSKLYGMAGLRAGAALGRLDLIDRLRTYGAGILPATGMAAATASLACKDLVKTRRAEMKTLREEQLAFCEKHKIRYIPSVSNKWMIDAGIPARELAWKLAAENVYIGRSWPAWPSYARITIGTAAEMARFQQALLKVLAA